VKADLLGQVVNMATTGKLVLVTALAIVIDLVAKAVH